MMPREVSRVRFQVKPQEFGLCMDTPAQPTGELAGRLRHGDAPLLSLPLLLEKLPEVLCSGTAQGHQHGGTASCPCPCQGNVCMEQELR